LRGGKMLAEESPGYLRQQYNADSLEDVFLKLSVLQNMGKRRRSSIAQEIVEQVTVPAISNPPPNSLLGAPLIVDIVAFPPYCCRFSVFYPYCLSRNFPHVAFEQPAQKAKAASTTEMQMDS